MNSTPVTISSVDDIQKLASTVQSQIIKSCNVSCPQRKIRRKTDNISRNTELTCLHREARKAQRKAIQSERQRKAIRVGVRGVGVERIGVNGVEVGVGARGSWSRGSWGWDGSEELGSSELGWGRGIWGHGE